jgi:hypothetical protein
LPTAVTAFVGRALRGPVNRAVRVHSYAEYQQVFGGLWQPSTLSYAVEQFFENGGRVAVVVRVVNGGAPATITLPCGTESMTLEALSPGSREVLRASIDYDNIGSNETDRFNLVLQRVRTLGSEHIEDQEIFRRLRWNQGTYAPGAARAAGIDARARPRRVPSVRPERTFRPGARHPIGYVDSNPDGDDGSAIDRLRPDRFCRSRDRTIRAARVRRPALPVHSAAIARPRRRPEPAARGRAVLP